MGLIANLQKRILLWHGFEYAEVFVPKLNIGLNHEKIGQ